MKKNLLLKSACSISMVVLGALVPLSVASALDIQDRVRQEQLGGGGTNDMRSTLPSDTTLYQYDRPYSPPTGAQGPIRSDMMAGDSGDRWQSEPMRNTFNEDLQKRLGPIGGVGTP